MVEHLQQMKSKIELSSSRIDPDYGVHEVSFDLIPSPTILLITHVGLVRGGKG